MRGYEIIEHYNSFERFYYIFLQLSKKCKALCHFSHILQDVPSVMDHDDVDDNDEEDGGEVGDEMEDCDSEPPWPDDLN